MPCLLEGVKVVAEPFGESESGRKIGHFASWLGAEPLKRLYDTVVGPIAEPRSKSAWYRQCAWSACGHKAVFRWVLKILGEEGGRTVSIDATTLEANAALKSIVRRDNGQGYNDYLKELAQSSEFCRYLWGR